MATNDYGSKHGLHGDVHARIVDKAKKQKHRRHHFKVRRQIDRAITERTEDDYIARLLRKARR